MTELLAIVGLAALFAVFGLVHRARERPPDCGRCPLAADPSICAGCRAACDAPETNHGEY